MTIMVYVYCPLTVVTSHHFLPSCTQIGVTLNDMTSFPAKKSIKGHQFNIAKVLKSIWTAATWMTKISNLSATWQEVMRRHHCQWTVNIYHNSHHGFYLAVKIVSNILKKAQGRKFEKEWIQFIDYNSMVLNGGSVR